MNQFKDFAIEIDKPFTGDKITPKKLLNREIKVLDFKIEPSKKKENSDYLTLQIVLDNEKRVVFSGAKGLINQIKQVKKDKLPFITTIRSDSDYYEFT